MGAANVFIKERDLSVRVPGFDGVYNAIMIRAKKGPINYPILISDETSLLNWFTPNKTVKVGYDFAYYSALAVLQKTNKLWVTRVANNALYGGAVVNVAGSTVAYSQMDEISAPLPEMTFNVSGITDGSNKITVSNVTGGTPNDLNGRVINLSGVGSYTVTAVNASELTLSTSIDNDISFVGTASASVSASVDFVSFDVSGLSDGDATVDVSNLSSGVSGNLVGKDISIVVDGVVVVKTVSSVLGSTLTLDSVIPAAVADIGTAFVGSPSVTFDVSGVLDGVADVTYSNVLPAYITASSLVGKTADLLIALDNSTTQAESLVINSVLGSVITFDSIINNGMLVDTTTAIAPFIEASADGFMDPTAFIQTDNAMTIFASDEGEWSKDLRIEIITDPVIVKEADAFIINVYFKDNVVVPVETFTASRIEGKKDGYGRNIFLDELLESSNYISGISNPLVDSSVLPAAVTSKLNLIKFVGGDDGAPVTDTNMVFSADLMANKNSYPMTLFLDGGWATVGFQKKLIEICENRKDSMAILSVPISAEFSNNYLNEIVDYRKMTLNANTSHGALFSCHVEITDKFNDRTIFVAPDGYAAASVNYSAANYEIWYPPAGFKRGNLNVNDTLIRFKDGDMDYLYDQGINPIRFYPGKGIAIWGQKTLSSRPSSLDRMNVRLLLMVIEPAIAEFLEDYLFDLNTDGIRTLVRIGIENYMENIKARNGVYDFYVVCDDTNNTGVDIDNHRMNVDVFIKPVQSVEYIYFTTILTPTGVDFKIAQAAL